MTADYHYHARKYEVHLRDKDSTLRLISRTVSTIRDFETEETSRCRYVLYFLLKAPSVTDDEKEQIKKFLEQLEAASRGLQRHLLSPAFYHDFYTWRSDGFATVIGNAKCYGVALTETSAFAHSLLTEYFPSCHGTADGIKYHIDRLGSSGSRLQQLHEYIAELELHRDRLAKCARDMARLLSCARHETAAF